MKRTCIPLLLVAAIVSMAMGQQADNKTKPARRERALRPAAERRAAEMGQVAQRLQKQMEDLRSAHQDLIADLRSLQATAAKEKATETAAQIDKLISRQQQDFQRKMQQLEQQQQEAQKAARERVGNVEGVKPQGRKAPDFELKSFDGKTVKLASYSGSIVVLEWLNTDCPFVQYHYEKAGTMIQLAGKYKDKNVVWLAVNSTNQTAPEANREFAKKYKLPYPILDDRSGTVGRLYGAITTPHMFIISKDGLVVYDGAIDNAPNGKTIDGADTVNYVDKALSELTTGRLVSIPKTQSYGCSVKYPAQ
jgi:peroxiredoxin